MKEFIIDVNDEVTLNYVLGYAMRVHAKVVRFYIVLWPTEEGYDEAYQVQEEQHDENNEMSNIASYIVPPGAQQRRFLPLTHVVSLGDSYLDCTPLEFRAGSKITYK